MKAFLKLFLLAAASLGLYGFVFGTLLDRPLTRGIIFEMLDAKVAHAADSTRPQLYVLAGSNARFSHSCETLAAELGAPCTNMGIAAGMGIDTQLTALRKTAIPGDVVYMPLEYSQFAASKKAVLNSAEAGEWFNRDPAGLYDARGPEGLLNGFFHFDLAYGLQAGIETVFSAVGGQRRFGLHTMNEMGDEIGHDAEKAAEYQSVIANWDWTPPTLEETLPSPTESGGARDRIVSFLKFAHENDVTVIGGLPTTFDDAPIPEAVIAGIQQLFQSNGADFITLDNKSQYPRTDFYDTSFHLTEANAKTHSRTLAAKLAEQPAVTKLSGE